MLVVDPRGKRVRERLVDEAVVRIAAVGVPAGEGWRDAQVLRASATESAAAVGATEQATPTRSPIAPCCALAEGIDDANNLMTGGDFGMLREQVPFS